MTDELFLPWEHVEESAADRVVVFEGGDEVGVRSARGGAGDEVRGHRCLLDSSAGLDLGWGGRDAIFQDSRTHERGGR